ncbi:MAG: hypothetical protein ACREOU_10290 [Candidatus Eiseniibacteriota bacterium]
MAHAYTPGLRVTGRTVVRRERRLPLKGEVLVEKGARVSATTIVARTLLPGNVQTVNLASALGQEPADVAKHLMRPIGSSVEAGEIIAQTRALFGLLKSDAKAPVKGVLESVSDVTGQLILREPPIPVEIDAYLEGTVVEVLPEEGVIVEAPAAFVQGIFGIGGETHGALVTAVSGPDDELTVDRLSPTQQGKVVVGGSYVNHAVLKEAIRIGIKAIVVGGFDDRDLRDLLGHDLGVAITGQESLGITLVLTEGFGRIRMAERTFQLLKRLEGREAAVSGATQIRAGVLRPEIVVPLTEAGSSSAEGATGGMEIGSLLRCIRGDHFGRIGRITALPAPLQELGSESHARVLEAELDGVGRVILPRANVELIEA